MVYIKNPSIRFIESLARVLSDKDKDLGRIILDLDKKEEIISKADSRNLSKDVEIKPLEPE